MAGLGSAGGFSRPRWASFALLLDRRISLWPAMLASWQVVLANPATMALWSLLILAVVLLGMAPCMLGLALASLPWLEPMPASSLPRSGGPFSACPQREPWLQVPAGNTRQTHHDFGLRSRDIGILPDLGRGRLHPCSANCSSSGTLAWSPRPVRVWHLCALSGTGAGFLGFWPKVLIQWWLETMVFILCGGKHHGSDHLQHCRIARIAPAIPRQNWGWRLSMWRSPYCQKAPRARPISGAHPNGHIPVQVDGPPPRGEVVLWESMACAVPGEPPMARAMAATLPGQRARDAEALRWDFWTVNELGGRRAHRAHAPPAMPPEQRKPDLADAAEKGLKGCRCARAGQHLAPGRARPGPFGGAATFYGMNRAWPVWAGSRSSLARRCWRLFPAAHAWLTSAAWTRPRRAQARH